MRAKGVELEAMLRGDPDDPEPYLVYGDWLQARDDPRGLLIAAQLEAERATSDAARYAAQTRAAALLALHDAALRGPLCDEPRGALSWRRGFAATLGVARPAGARAALAHPVARVVRRLVVGEVVARAELDRLVELARAEAPCLEELVAGTSRELGGVDGAPFRVEAVRVPAAFAADWLTAPARTANERRAAAMRWRAGRDPERTRRTSGTWLAERYLFELACAGSDDAWLAAELLPLYRTAVRATTLVPGARWLADARRLRPHASPGLARALWRYVEYHLEAAYDAPMIRDLPGLFWPLAVLWHPVLEPSLVAYAAGRLDRKPATPALRKRRDRLLAWLRANR